MIISITGKSGSGKSTLAKKISMLYSGIHIEIDKIGHEVTNYPEVQEELIKLFGKQVIKSGKTDRNYLGKIVFNDKKAMKKLEILTWKYMSKKIIDTIRENKDKLIVLDYILISETEFFEKSNLKILVNTPYETRMKRVLKRDGISKEKFDLRENASINYNLNDFDYITETSDIDNEILERLLKS